MCEAIRETLHIEHWDAIYSFEPSAEDNDRYDAFEHGRGEGRDIRLTFCRGFWDKPSYESQLKTLIHEHLHSLMQPYDNAAALVGQWSHTADKCWVEQTCNLGKEHVVDHLAAVVFDLVKERLETL